MSGTPERAEPPDARVDEVRGRGVLVAANDRGERVLARRAEERERADDGQDGPHGGREPHLGERRQREEDRAGDEHDRQGQPVRATPGGQRRKEYRALVCPQQAPGFPLEALSHREAHQEAFSQPNLTLSRGDVDSLCRVQGSVKSDGIGG
jgi:hypothetical protein